MENKMKKNNQKHTKQMTVKWLLCLFGIAVYLVIYYALNTKIEYGASWAALPEIFERLGVNPIRFWVRVKQIFWIGMMLPIGFCLSAKLELQRLKKRFGFDKRWLTALATIFFLFWFIPWLSWHTNISFLNGNLARKLIYTDQGRIVHLLCGLFMGHCLRAGLFAGEERIRGEK